MNNQVKENFYKKETILGKFATKSSEAIRLKEEESMSTTDISKAFGIPRGTVYGIVTYRRWANI